ncbi:MAG: hypothetical protein HZB26_14940 [Candidatus Hydrogenedentes bacterium]|nr:hypothetical protein [Candidatus Hydrogenedentota bacterium]
MKPEKLRTLLIIAFRLALALSGASLIYLLFVFGHTETAPPNRILFAATLCGTSALVAGLLQWVGLPASTQDSGGKKAPKGRAAGRGK